MTTEAELYSDTFAIKVWVIDLDDILVAAPADAREIVDAYRIATIERRTELLGGAK